MQPHIQLLRPLNSAMAAVAVFVGALVATGYSLFSSPYLMGMGVAMLVAFIYTGAGNALNDYYDRFTDRVNHPTRPIPRKKITPRAAKELAGILFGLGALLALFIGWPDFNLLCLAVALVNGVLLAGYEMRLKRLGFVGNLTVSWLTASLFLFGGASVVSDPGPTLFPLPVIILAMLAFLASVGREITKGIEDVRGDRDRKTLPRIIGVRRSGYMAAGWTCAAIALSPLPVYPLGLFSPWLYLPIVVFADGIFIYSVFVVFKNAAIASKTTKLAMVAALLAFLAGAMTVVR
jgi:geranylgeranylglycerol-phosphate geranylgeranyltransferase